MMEAARAYLERREPKSDWAAAFDGMEEALGDANFFGHLHEEHEPPIREWLRTR